MIVVVSFLGSVNGNGIHNGVAVLIERTGGAAYLSGLITGLFSLSALVARFIGGAISDAKGRKPVILVGCTLLVAGCLLALVTTSDIMLLPARIIMGLGFGMIVTASAAAVADIVPASRVGEGLGYQSLAYALAMAAGPGMAVAVASGGRFVMFAFFGGLSLLALVLTALCKFNNGPAQEAAPANEEQKPKGLIDSIVEPAALRPAVIAAIAHFGLCIYMAFMSLYAEQAGIAGGSWFFAVAAVSMVLIRLVLAKAFDSCKPNTLLVPSLLVGILGFALMLIFNNFWAMMVAGVCFGLFAGILIPVLSAEAVRRSPENRHGVASAMYYVGCDVGMGVGSFLWVATVSIGGFGLTFGLGIAFLAVALVASLLLLRPTR